MRGQPRWCSAGSATLWYALSSLAFLLATWRRRNYINLKRDSICRKTHALVTQRGQVNLLNFFSEQHKPQHLKIYLKETKIFLEGGVCVLKLKVIYSSDILWVWLRSGIHGIFIFCWMPLKTGSRAVFGYHTATLLCAFRSLRKINFTKTGRVSW